MSRSPYFYVERLNSETNRYELQHPLVWNWEHTEHEFADLFPYNGCHNLFSIIENKPYGSYPEMAGIHYGLPHDVCDEIQESFNDCSYVSDWGDTSEKITPTARWFTYADMYIYYLEHPKVPDYEAMDEVIDDDDNNKIILMDNPIQTLKRRVDAFLEVMDSWGWRDDYSQIRIVYWIT